MIPITNFNQIVGNESAKLLLQEAISTAKNEGTSLNNILIYGNSGCGKSMMASVIAKSMDVPFEEVNCSLINSNPQIFNQMILKMISSGKGGIIFLDELHSLKLTHYESIFRYIDEDTVFVKYPDRIVPLKLEGKKITFICATSEIQNVPLTFRNRMEITIKLQPYNHDEIITIARSNLNYESIELDEPSLEILCNASRGIPRNLENIITIIHNFKSANSFTGMLTPTEIKQALSRIKIDEFGLDDVDRSYIRHLHYVFNNNPVGISYLSNVMDESEEMIVTKHEPWLLKAGYITRTSKGRMLQPKGIMYAISIGAED